MLLLILGWVFQGLGSIFPHVSGSSSGLWHKQRLWMVWVSCNLSRTRILAPLCCFLGLESSYQSPGMGTTREESHCACRLPTKHLGSYDSLCSGKGFCIYSTCLRITHSISSLLLWQSTWNGATPRRGASFFLPHAQQCLLGDPKFSQVGGEFNPYPQRQCLSPHFFYLRDFKLSLFGALDSFVLAWGFPSWISLWDSEFSFLF